MCDRMLATLVGLRTLDLSGCDELGDVSPLSRAGAVGVCQAAQSKSLRLQQLRDVPLTGLVGLTHSTSATCSELRDMPVLSALVGLHTLHRSHLLRAAPTTCRRSLSGLVNLCTLILGAAGS